MIPIGSALAGALMGKPRIPPCGVVLAGAVLEIIGVVLLSRISTSPQIDTSQYGFQVLAGLGTGMVNAALIILVPYIMETKDLCKPLYVHRIQTLTSTSCWLRCMHPIPYLGRTGRPRDRRLHLNTLHSPAPDRHSLARNRGDASREDRDYQGFAFGQSR